MQLFYLVIALRLLQTAASYAVQQSLTQTLQSQLSKGASVFSLSDANYTKDITPRWTTYGAPTYRAAVKPKTEDDVANAMVIAQGHNVSFLATGGGHGYSASYAMTGCHQALEIDLSNFQKIAVDADQNTLTVGPGVRIHQIMDPVYQAGKEFRVSLGAGIGRYQGVHGLMIDNLLSVHMVTAAGQLIEASESQNPDLFWGIRGAGFNYGVITEATYRIHDYANNGYIMSADLQFAGKDNASFFQTLSSYDNGKLSEKLSLFVATGWDDKAKAPYIMLNAVYLGPTNEGKDLIKPFLDIGPEIKNISTIPSNMLLESALFGLDADLCEDGVNRNSYALNVKGIDPPKLVEAFNGLAEFQTKFPQACDSSLTVVYLPNQAAQAVDNDATAYPWRDQQASIMFTFTYPHGDSPVDDAANDLATSHRTSLQSTSGFSSLQVYVNGAHGDEEPETLYSAEKLPKLMDLKKKWDPGNVFRFNNPLPFQAEER